VTSTNFTGVVVPIADIDVGERDRSDLGDLTELAASIEAVGLLHPVVINGDWKLVSGDRRLAAVRDVLGWREVPVNIVDVFTARDLLQAEWDENTCRQPLTPAEAERARARRAHLLVDDAKRRQEEGRARGNAVQAGTVAPKLGETTAPTESRTAKIAATGTGYSGSTLDKVKSVREVAEQGVIRIGGERLPAPEPVREVAREALEAMQQHGAPVDRLHRQVAAAIEQHVEPDVEQQRARQLKAWRDALGGARMLREFDMTQLPDLLGEQEWASATLLIDAVAAQVEAFREARPNHLRVVQGA
jgi:ParB family chromosome partitioning protein